MKKIIVGLPIGNYSLMTDQEKYEYAMKRENWECQVYYSTRTFLDMLNTDQVDTENLLFYEVEVAL
jgi:hypothetical protein